MFVNNRSSVIMTETQLEAHKTAFVDPDHHRQVNEIFCMGYPYATTTPSFPSRVIVLLQILDGRCTRTGMAKKSIAID